MWKNEIREAEVLACLLLYPLDYKSFQEIRLFNSHVIFSAHFASLSFPHSFIWDCQSLFKYCNIKFFQGKGFTVLGLGFDYEVCGSSQWFENLSRGSSGFYVTNLVFSLLNIFMRSMEKWENMPLLTTGVDKAIPTSMVCKTIWDMQVH